MTKARVLLMFGLLAGLALPARAEEPQLADVKLPHDVSALTHGAETITSTCMSCHSLKYIHYQDLANLGIAKDNVDKWRGDKKKSDALIGSMDEATAKASFNGVVPPDLSLMAAAREGGGRYIYSYLIGYHSDGKGGTANSVYPVTRMPDVLGIADAKDPKQIADIQNTAKDVSAFLVWASDPHAAERKRDGYYVLGYIAFMTLLLFLWKKQIWREIDRRPKI